MNRLIYLLGLIWVVLANPAFASDPWELLQEGRQDPLRMPIEGCYVGARLQPVTGYIRVIIRNDHADRGLVIRYIRSYAAMESRDQSRAHTRTVYMIDGLQGKSIVRGALTRDRSTGRTDRVSVLRPGESCSMWLPNPPKERWRVVVGGVQIRSGGGFLDVLDRCIRVTGFRGGRPQTEPADCRVRFDRADYDPAKRYGARDARRDGDYLIFDHTTHWSDREL